MNSRLLYFVICVLSYRFSSGSVLSVGLSNANEVIDGLGVEIHCSTSVGSNYFKWYTSEQISSGNQLISTCFNQACAPNSFENKYSFTYSGTDLFVNISKVNTMDEKYWICANGSHSSDSKGLFLYVKVPVTGVSMDIPGKLEVQDTVTRSISCTTSYGRPEADFKFYKEFKGHSLEIIQNVYKTYNETGNGETKGTLVYIPSSSDDGVNIFCRANNTISQGPVTATNRVTIYIIACAIGTYGENCAYSCGNCHQQDTCNAVTGLCTNNCSAGYTGTYCTEACPVGKFGRNCIFSCGNCLNQTICSRFDGSCDAGCELGYKPPFCQQENAEFKAQSPEVKSYQLATAIVGTVAVVVIIGNVVAAICYVTRRRRKHRDRTIQSQPDISNPYELANRGAFETEHQYGQTAPVYEVP